MHIGKKSHGQRRSSSSLSPGSCGEADGATVPLAVALPLAVVLGVRVPLLLGVPLPLTE